MEDGLIQRLYIKALGNQVVIAVGSSSSSETNSMPNLAEKIIKYFKVDFRVNRPLQFFHKWNELVEKAEKVSTRQELTEFVHEIVKDFSTGHFLLSK